jgi:hypothetical protein
VVTRARGARAGRPTRIGRGCAEQTDRLDGWSRLGGAAAAGRRRHFVLADCCSQILVRGDDGARAIGAIDDDDDDAAAAPAALDSNQLRVIDNRSEKLQH